MKKSHLPEILACVVVLLIVAFFALWWKREKDRSACIINIRNVQLAFRGYHCLHPSGGFTSQQVWNDIFTGPDAYLRKPKCPSGGTYTFHKPEPSWQDPGFVYCTCSHAEKLNHKPEGTEDW